MDLCLFERGEINHDFDNLDEVVYDTLTNPWNEVCLRYV
jgi:hypothetical protein